MKQNRKLVERIIEKLEKMSEPRKGAKCSESGAKYELRVWKVCKELYYDEKPFCVISKSELAGSSTGHDIKCLFDDETIPIEIKKSGASDWSQVSIDVEDGKWSTKRTNRTKAEEEVQDIFDGYLECEDIFNGKLPPPVYENWLHPDWVEYKKEHPEFEDHYIRDCPDDLISVVHAAKGIEYIQISDYGLYHTGKNICGFSVPKFVHKSQIRVRTKINYREDPRTGFMRMSVVAAVQPFSLKGSTLEPSPYSLDHVNKTPPDISEDSEQHEKPRTD